MKRKLLIVALVCSMAFNLVACGNAGKDESVETSDTMPTEEIVDTEVSETEEIVETAETVEEVNTEEPVVEEEETFAEEDALAKVNLLIAAYDELAKSEKEVEWCILDRCESLNPHGNLTIKTSDGIELNSNENWWISLVTGVNYFYNYVNKDNSYYDFTEYITSKSKDDIYYENSSEETINKLISGDLDSNYSLMGEAIGVINYLKQNGEITIAEFKSEDDSTIGDVSGIDVVYEAVISLNGENSGLVAVFDKDGNLLNINTENAYDKFDYIFTFDQN